MVPERLDAYLAGTNTKASHIADRMLDKSRDKYPSVRMILLTIKRLEISRAVTFRLNPELEFRTC